MFQYDDFLGDISALQLRVFELTRKVAQSGSDSDWVKARSHQTDFFRLAASLMFLTTDLATSREFAGENRIWRGSLPIIHEVGHITHALTMETPPPSPTPKDVLLRLVDVLGHLTVMADASTAVSK